jgi:hypothetical protein
LARKQFTATFYTSLAPIGVRQMVTTVRRTMAAASASNDQQAANSVLQVTSAIAGQ